MYRKIGALFLLLFGSVVLLRWINSIPEIGWTIDIVSVEESNGIGGGRICCPKLYDVEGRGHTVCSGHVSWHSSAPLYALRQSAMESLPQDGDGCLLYPDTALPDQIDRRNKFVPLDVRFSLHSSERRIRIGQSVLLKVQATVEREFSSANFLIPQPSSGKIKVQFAVDAPNFEVKPTGVTESLFLSALQPIEYAWVLAPKRNTWGIQYIVANVYVGSGEDAMQIPFGLRVEVKSEPGPSPTLVKYGKLVSSIVTVMVSMVLAIKNLLEIVEERHSISRPRRQQKRHK